MSLSSYSGLNPVPPKGVTHQCAASGRARPASGVWGRVASAVISWAVCALRSAAAALARPQDWQRKRALPIHATHRTAGILLLRATEFILVVRAGIIRSGTQRFG